MKNRIINIECIFHLMQCTYASVFRDLLKSYFDVRSAKMNQLEEKHIRDLIISDQSKLIEMSFLFPFKS